MLSLAPWEPFRALRRRDDAFEEMFRDFFRRGGEEGGIVEPAVELAESDGEVTVKMENGMLTVTLPRSTQPKAREVKVAVG